MIALPQVGSTTSGILAVVGLRDVAELTDRVAWFDEQDQIIT